MLLSVFGYQAESKYSHAKNDNYGSIDFSIAIKSMLEIINLIFSFNMDILPGDRTFP